MLVLGVVCWSMEPAWRSIEGCIRYQHDVFIILLFIDEASNLINSPHTSHSDRELLTLLAKSDLVLAAKDEIQKLAEESKEIQGLQRCAEIGGLLSKYHFSRGSIPQKMIKKNEKKTLY